MAQIRRSRETDRHLNLRISFLEEKKKKKSQAFVYASLPYRFTPRRTSPAVFPNLRRRSENWRVQGKRWSFAKRRLLDICYLTAHLLRAWTCCLRSRESSASIDPKVRFPEHQFWRFVKHTKRQKTKKAAPSLSLFWENLSVSEITAVISLVSLFYKVFGSETRRAVSAWTLTPQK